LAHSLNQIGEIAAASERLAWHAVLEESDRGGIFPTFVHGHSCSFVKGTQSDAEPLQAAAFEGRGLLSVNIY